MKWHLALLVCLLPGATVFGQSFRFPADNSGKADLKYVNGIPVLTVAGTPEEIGAAIGKLALKPAKLVTAYPRDLLKWRDLDNLWGMFLATGKGMYRRFPEDYSQELDAMVKSAGVDRDLVIAGNTFFDIKKSFACSAVLVDRDRSATRGPLFARNLDYPSLGYIDQYSLLTVYRPKGKLAFASVGFPGLVGVVSGVNEAGLCLGVLEVFDIKIGEKHFDPKGTPYALCLRRVLEKARTIDEAIKVLHGLRRTTSINVAMADRKEVAVLEISPTKVIRREPTKGVCAATNHFNSKELKPKQPINLDRSFERLATMEELRGAEGKATPETLRKKLHEVNLDWLTLQTMVIEPVAMKLHLSIGKAPASRGPLRTLDLRKLLGVDRR